MKKITLLFVFTVLNTILFAQKNMFKIDYSFYISEDIKNADIKTENDAYKKELIKIAQMITSIQTEDPLLTEAWVSKDYTRVKAELLEEVVYLLDKANGKSYMLYPTYKMYTTSSKDDETMIPAYTSDQSLEDIDLEYIKGPTKTIAGYVCHLAKLNIKQPEESPISIEIWYTEQIPSVYWGEYSFLKKLNGAALQVSIGGIGINAEKVSKETFDLSLFQIPEDYELTDDSIDDKEYLDYEIGENRFMYLDTITKLYGIKDADGNTITDPLYTFIGPYYNKQACVSNEEYKYGTIDLDGNIKLPFEYDYLMYDENTNMFSFSLADNFGLMDDNGKIIIPSLFESLSFFTEGYAIFSKNQKYGLVDAKGNEIVPALYDYITSNSKTQFIALVGEEEYALFDIKNNKKITKNYQSIIFSEDSTLILALQGEKYGYIDQSGKVVIPFQYPYASAFANGVASVTLDENEDYFWINTKGERVNIEEE